MGVAATGALLAALIIATPSDRPADTGAADDPAPSAPSATAGRPGIGAIIVFRPAAGVTDDEAYAQMERVIHARARAQKGVSATVERVERDRARVTLTGTREPITLSEIVAGSAIAVYDLDEVLVGTFSSFHKAVLRARELAPGAPARVAYLFRNGRLVRGPAPTAADLRRITRTLPPGSQILELPEGFAILRRQYVRNARGDAERLRSTQFFVVRDRPAVSPLQVTGTGKSTSDDTLPGRPITTPIVLSVEGRRTWDDLLRQVSARAASSGQPQRIALSTNGDIWQMTTADATGRLDTRPGSPALEFGSFQSGTGGFGVRSPVGTDVARNGPIPAIVWVADTYRIGPSPVVLGEVVEPVPAQVRRMLSLPGSERGDPSTLRRALEADGPDGRWSVWNYLLVTGAPRAVVAGPRPDDAFGFGCPRTKGIQDCGGSAGFQPFAVPTATRTLRFTSSSGMVREAAAANGWALVLGPRRSRGAPPRTTTTAEALGESGQVLATLRGRFSLP
ncbi:hypothetical protein [Miltoncostaea oceani]|uniref:hypothetical protein n=1 Tax=Miltoncostaea oceani TaxID=2843216 RepID=UPI001C3D476A|nr:hypothetical protein [Miltoncostaea oceani]